MGSGHALSNAFYRHPAFAPHRLLRRLGIKKFWICNAAVTIFCAGSLFLGAREDNALILGSGGYGFLEHPGIFGWFIIQLFIPISIYGLLKKTVRTRSNYVALSHGQSVQFASGLYRPLLNFVGLNTDPSRRLFSLLFTAGFAGFAWNTYQNLHPGELAPLDFWDSVNFLWGYLGTRIYKFYIDALLLPSVIHIFAGIVWQQSRFFQGLVKSEAVRLLPFCSDRCGGMGFLADLILAPTIVALAASGLAFFGVVYTHRMLDLSTGMGVVVQLGVLTAFYIVPTNLIRSAIVKLKSREVSRIYAKQEAYYEEMLLGRLRGETLRTAYDHTKYFDDVVGKIDRVPKWPHLVRVFGTLGVTLTPALFISTANLVAQAVKLLAVPT